MLAVPCPTQSHPSGTVLIPVTHPASPKSHHPPPLFGVHAKLTRQKWSCRPITELQGWWTRQLHTPPRHRQGKRCDSALSSPTRSSVTAHPSGQCYGRLQYSVSQIKLLEAATSAFRLASSQRWDHVLSQPRANDKFHEEESPKLVQVLRVEAHLLLGCYSVPSCYVRKFRQCYSCLRGFPRISKFSAGFLVLAAKASSLSWGHCMLY